MLGMLVVWVGMGVRGVEVEVKSAGISSGRHISPSDLTAWSATKSLVEP
jgi:hypothetical protein